MHRLWPPYSRRFNEFTVGRSVLDLPANYDSVFDCGFLGDPFIVRPGESGFNVNRDPLCAIAFHNMEKRRKKLKCLVRNFWCRRCSFVSIYFYRLRTVVSYGDSSVWIQRVSDGSLKSGQAFDSLSGSSALLARRERETRLIVYTTRVESPLNDSSSPIDPEIGYRR